MPKAKTIEQLRRELELKEKLVGKLHARRQKALTRLESIDRLIAALTGAVAPAIIRGRRGPAPKVKAAPKRRAPRGESLPAYIMQVLDKSKKPMRVLDIQKAVVAAGYKTGSKDFYGIVATTLRDKSRFAKVKRGIYTLK